MLNFLKVSFNISYITFEFLNLYFKDLKFKKRFSEKSSIIRRENCSAFK